MTETDHNDLEHRLLVRVVLPDLRIRCGARALSDLTHPRIVQADF